MSLQLSLAPDHSEFLVELPSGHHITIPATAGSMALLRRLLLEQTRQEFEAGLRRHDDAWRKNAMEQAAAFAKAWGVGTPASPTQHEVEHQLEHCTESGQGSALQIKDFHETCPWCRDTERREARAPKREATTNDLF